MKYSELSSIKPLGVRMEEAGKLIGNTSLFRSMWKAGWIKPVIERHSCVLFAVADIERCFDRLRAGDFPEVKA